MSSVPQMVLAEEDAVAGRESPRLHVAAGKTLNVGLIHVAIHFADVLHQKRDDWACMKRNESPTMLQVKTGSADSLNPNWRVNRLYFFR